MVQRQVQAVVLLLAMVNGYLLVTRRHAQKPGEINSRGFPVIDSLAGVQQVYPPYHFINGAEAQLGHDLPKLLRNEGEVVDQVLRLARKLFPQLRVLGGDAHGAGVQVTLAQHDAAANNESGGSYAELFRTQQSGYCHVASGLE